MVLMAVDDDGFFLLGLANELLAMGEVCVRKAELERGKFTWHCFNVTSLSGVLTLAAAVAVMEYTYEQNRTKILEYGYLEVNF